MLGAFIAFSHWYGRRPGVLQGAYYLLLTTCYLSLTPYCLILTIYCLLLTKTRRIARRLHLTTYYLLLATYYSLLTTYYLLLTTYYLLRPGVLQGAEESCRSRRGRRSTHQGKLAVQIIL